MATWGKSSTLCIRPPNPKLIPVRNYILGSDGVCHRTQVAVRTQTMDLPSWTDFVAGHQKDDGKAEIRTEKFITSQILQVYHEEAEKALYRLKRMEHTKLLRQRQVIIRRWEQIQRLIRDAFEKNGSEANQGAGQKVFQ